MLAAGDTFRAAAVAQLQAWGERNGVAVVAQGQARIRTQLSAAHEQEHLDAGLRAFRKVAAAHGIVGKNKQQIVEMYGM